MNKLIIILALALIVSSFAVLGAENTTNSIKTILLWTDKPIYKTGDTIKFFGKVVQTDDTPFTPEEGAIVGLNLISPKGANALGSSLQYNPASGYYEKDEMISETAEKGIWTAYLSVSSKSSPEATKSDQITFQIDDGTGCSDSDGGMNYYEYGYITFFNGKEYVTGKDQCGVSYDEVPSSNPNLLNEKSCRSDGQAIENLYECPGGCYDGACKSEPTTVKEEVKCVFSNSGSTQTCYTTDNKYKCSGVDTCVVSVSGTKGMQLTWKSTCGGYAYTTIDGNNEYAEFACQQSKPTCTACVGGTPTGEVDQYNCPIYVCPTTKCPVDCICDSQGNVISCTTTQPVCGNKICESGEADYCPPCSKEEGIACSCSMGTCPSDCATQKSEYSCEETDKYGDYYTKGITYWVVDGKTNQQEDYCADSNTLSEGFCISTKDESQKSYQRTTYFCEYGCKDGACIQTPAANTCTDSEKGVNYYEKGYVTMTYPKEIFYDKCAVDEVSPEKADYYLNLLYEAYCYDSKQYAYADYQCPYGCSEGACKKMELKPTEKPIEIPKKERKGEPPESDKEAPKSSEKDYVCNGCELDDKCYPFGYRKDNKFCSDNYEFTGQIKEEEKCDNNFECSSNLCIDSKCVSSGLIQKILSWFKGFFS